MSDYIRDSESRTAYAVERDIFKQLLQLGRSLLLLFMLRAEQANRESVTTEKGEQLPYHSKKKRTYFSIFGAWFSSSFLQLYNFNRVNAW